ncbi:hypothetical protein QVD99_002681 [Batrachochytrium dendrobatidis]|nr:hypothetical protein QVD99_002681 [Batrachochytrium dendrobatidis]
MMDGFQDQNISVNIATIFIGTSSIMVLQSESSNASVTSPQRGLASATPIAIPNELKSNSLMLTGLSRSPSARPPPSPSSILVSTVDDRKGVVQRARSGTLSSTANPNNHNSHSNASDKHSCNSHASNNCTSQTAMSFSKSLLFRVMVFRKILLINDGRDKVLKCAQYAAKLLLWLYFSKDSKTHSITQTQASKIASHFSLARKIIRLGHWLEPINDHMNLSKEGLLTIPKGLSLGDQHVRMMAPLNAWIGILNDIADDVICLSKMGVLPQLPEKWLQRTTAISDRCWYASIFIDAHAGYHSMLELHRKVDSASDPVQQQVLKDKLFMQRVSMLKLAMDFAFCSIDVFHLGDKVDDGLQVVTGFTAALLGTFKLYRKLK